MEHIIYKTQSVVENKYKEHVTNIIRKMQKILCILFWVLFLGVLFLGLGVRCSARHLRAEP